MRRGDHQKMKAKRARCIRPLLWSKFLMSSWSPWSLVPVPAMATRSARLQQASHMSHLQPALHASRLLPSAFSAGTQEWGFLRTLCGTHTCIHPEGQGKPLTSEKWELMYKCLTSFLPQMYDPELHGGQSHDISPLVSGLLYQVYFFSHSLPLSLTPNFCIYTANKVIANKLLPQVHFLGN